MFAVALALRKGCPPQEIAQSDALIAALAPFAKPDKWGSWNNQDALLVQALHYNTPASLHERTPEICSDTGRIIVSWVRLDNRAELCGALGLSNRAELTDPQIILEAHRKWGCDCAGKLEGDFSFVIYDPAKREAYCARDSIGVKPFFYIQTDTHFIAASSVSAIKAIKRLHLAPNLKWIALFASGFGFADGETAYSGVGKLRAAHHLTVTVDGQEEPQLYFAFDPRTQHATSRDPVWVERYREAFHEAVDIRTRSQFLLGAENSGGLDSASILARLVALQPQDRDSLRTHSLVAHQQETDLLDELSDMLGLSQESRDIRPEILPNDDALKRAIVAIGHPPEHGQPILSASLFEWAQEHGLRTVFSGFGGDEIVTGYAKHLIDELHRRHAWCAVFDEIEGAPVSRIARFGRRLIMGPGSYETTQRAQLAAKLSATFLSREYLEDSGLRRQIEDWMLPDFGDQSVNAIALQSPGFRYGRTGRLESSALYAATFQCEYRFPLLDRQLIKLFLSAPSIEKRRRSMGRYLHRRAVAGSIPDSITWQPTKDMGPPLGGEFRFAKQPLIAFADLPYHLRSIFDPGAFGTAQDLIANTPEPMEHGVMRARYSMWHVNQLILWLGDN